MEGDNQPGCLKTLLYFIPIFLGLAFIHLLMKGASEALMGLPLKGFEFPLGVILFLIIKFSYDKKK
jgi:hypothetical protein